MSPVSELKAKLAVVEAEQDARAKDADVQRQRGVTTVVEMDMISKDPRPQAPRVAGKILFLIATRKMQEWIRICKRRWVLDDFQKWPGCHIC